MYDLTLMIGPFKHIVMITLSKCIYFVIYTFSLSSVSNFTFLNLLSFYMIKMFWCAVHLHEKKISQISVNVTIDQCIFIDTYFHFSGFNFLPFDFVAVFVKNWLPTWMTIFSNMYSINIAAIYFPSPYLSFLFEIL